MKTTVFLHINLSKSDAETFIRENIEAATGQNATVKIQTMGFMALHAALTAAKNELAIMRADCSPKIAAIKKLREEAAAQGLEIGLADAKKVVEDFLM